MRASILTPTMSLCLALIASTAGAASGGAPLVVGHHGYVLDGTDQAVNAADAAFQFAIYDQPLPVPAQVLEWEASCAVNVSRGFYAVVLGEAPCAGTSTLETADLPPDGDRWLQVSIDGVALLPRLRLAAAPSAAIAGLALDAQKLGGVAAGAILDTNAGTLLASALPAGAITDAHVATNAGIAASKIAGLGALAGKATISDADVAADAGIAASKIAGLGALAAKATISDADVTAGAGIAVSKIAGLGPYATKGALDAGDVTDALGFTPFNPSSGLTLGANGLTVGSNQLVAAAGRVGIGTASPAVSLDVAGTDAIRIPVGTTAERPASPTAGMLRYNSTLGALEFFTGGNWVKFAASFTASGGTTSDAGGIRTHTFTSSGTFTVGSVAGTVEVLVVGGGGGGGCDRAGGGGGGGLVYDATYAVSAGQAITVTVGDGGNGSTSDAQKGANGQASVFGSITAQGGGGGGSENSKDGAAGGSGGGASYGGTGGAGTSGQGRNGGNGVSSPRSPSGGGGAGAVGQNGNTSNPGPAGGAGLQYFGTFYAGGGGAGDNRDSLGTSGPGQGGQGGGGAGGLYQASGKDGSPGAANTGGGGGGGGLADTGFGGKGGSGVVIVRYPIP